MTESVPKQRLEAFSDGEIELLRAAIEYHLCRADQRELKVELGDEIALEIQRRRMSGGSMSGSEKVTK